MDQLLLASMSLRISSGRQTGQVHCDPYNLDQFWAIFKGFRGLYPPLSMNAHRIIESMNPTLKSCHDHLEPRKKLIQQAFVSFNLYTTFLQTPCNCYLYCTHLPDYKLLDFYSVTSLECTSMWTENMSWVTPFASSVGESRKR